MTMRAWRRIAIGVAVTAPLVVSGCAETQKSASLQPLTRSIVPQDQPPATGDPAALARECSNANTPPANAVETCTKLLETGLLDPSAQARALFNRGAASMSLNGVESALLDFEMAAKLDPDLYEVWPARERLLVGIGGRAGDDALVRQVARLARRRSRRALPAT